MAAIFGFSPEKIIAAVKEMYTAVAMAPEQRFHFPVGREACRRLGYAEDILNQLPASALESFAGVGYPFSSGAIRPGDRVLDVGAGSGTDTLIASRLVGSQGKVWALDMTPAMLAKLRELVTSKGVRNVEVVEGNAEQIPLPDASIDVITSNGVLNLVPNKRRAVAEMFRVLRPGGRVQIADVVVRRPVTRDCADDPKLWVECVVGAKVDEDYLALFRDTGFEGVTVLREYDYFALSRSHHTREIAQRLGAHAIEISMQRAAVAPSRFVQLARRCGPRRLMIKVRRRGLAGLVALTLSVLACYGMLAATALLSLAGITLAINETAWAGIVMLFAALTAAAVVDGIRRHGGPTPTVFGLVGFATLGYTQFVNYTLPLELLGFGMLAAAVIFDLRLKRRAENAGPHEREVAA